MKNRMAVFMLATTLLLPGAALWASAGDANTQGSNGTVTGTAASTKPVKKHHGHHHVKKPVKPAATITTPASQ